MPCWQVWDYRIDDKKRGQAARGGIFDYLRCISTKGVPVRPERPHPWSCIRVLRRITRRTFGTSLFVPHCVPPAPCSTLQHAGCTRMMPEIAHAAIALAWLASKAAASRSKFGACASVQVLSSSPSHAVGDIEERKQKDQDARRCESSGRECHAPGPV